MNAFHVPIVAEPETFGSISWAVISASIEAMISTIWKFAIIVVVAGSLKFVNTVPNWKVKDNLT